MKELKGEEQQIVKHMSAQDSDDVKKPADGTVMVYPIAADEKVTDLPEKSIQEQKVDLELKSNSNLQKIEIGKYVFVLGDNPEADKQLRTLASIVRWENTHFQISKQFITFIIMSMLVLLNLALPTKSRAALIGNLTLCGTGYWLLNIAFLFFCGIMSWISVLIIRKE